LVGVLALCEIARFGNDISLEDDVLRDVKLDFMDFTLRYEDAHEEASFTNFREDGTVPGDSTNIGTTWQFVNKAGGPDRRFVNNRQIPIQRYSHLQFSHPLLTFCLQFSRANVADELRNAFRLLTTGQTVITTTDAYDASGIVP
jgi:hypothetical protein